MGCGLQKKPNIEYQIPNDSENPQLQPQLSLINKQQTKDQEEDKQNQLLNSKHQRKIQIDHTVAISVGTGFSNDYDILRRIGKARKYQVFLAQQKATLQLRAVGVANKLKESNIVETYKEQVAIMKKFDHPNLVKIYGEYDDKEYYYCVFEYLEGGTLQQRLDQKNVFSEYQVQQLIQQLLSALNYLHQAGYVHNNISPSKIIFQTKNTDKSIKLIGFGQYLKPKENYQQDRFNQITYNYSSPEQLKCRISFKSDIWSCGVLIFFLLSGTFPFHGKNECSVKQSIMKGIFDFGWVKASEEAKQLIQDMLTYENGKRPSAKKCLKNPWLVKKIPNQETYLLQSKQALSNMSQYHVTNQAQNLFYTYMVNCMAPIDESNELMEVFKQFDRNNDGKLKKEEIIRAYKEVLQVQDCEAQVAKIFQEIDDNQNEFIDYHEFLMATLDRQKMLGRKNLIKMFKILDKDHSGTIDMRELKKAFGGQQFDQEFWQEFKNEVDKNGDGKISKTEFIKCMEGLLENNDRQKVRKVHKKKIKKLE